MHEMKDLEIRIRLNEINCLDKTLQNSKMEILKEIAPELRCELETDCTELDDSYICHHYTFNISVDSNIFRWTELTFPIHEGHCSVFDELEKNKLILSSETMSDAQIIIYYEINNGIEKHIHSGRIRKQEVVSKWGRGHIWKHKPEHVPVIYEDAGSLRMRFFKNPKPEQTYEFLRQKAEC